MPDRRPIEHVTLHAPSSAAFYERVLETLGISGAVDAEGRLAFGQHGEFGVYATADRFYKRSHVAFAAASREEVDGFHAAAVAVGGRSVDEPRHRPEFAIGFYS